MLSLLARLDGERNGGAQGAGDEDEESRKKEVMDEQMRKKKKEEEREEKRRKKKEDQEREEQRRKKEKMEREEQSRRDQQMIAEKQQRAEQERMQEIERRMKREEEEKRLRDRKEKSEKIKRDELEQKRNAERKSKEARKHQVTEASFASLCKRSITDEVAACLRDNPDLLNCLAGLPLREAVLGRNREVVHLLLGMEGILVNSAAPTGLTALHVATANDDPKIIQKLLSHPGIDANPRNKSGLTPVKMATIRGKTQALKVLLESPLVEYETLDEDGNTLEDLLKAEKHLGALTISDGLKLFEAAMKGNVTSDRQKFVIFVANWKYSATGFKDLPSPPKDLKLAKEIFKQRNYGIHVIENSADILEDVCEYIENTEGFEESARNILQFVYMGHGLHKKFVQKHKKSNYQEGEIGDCLVGVDGTLCGELELALNIARGVSDRTKMCMIYDMCRVQTRDPEEDAPVFVEISTFDLKKEFQDLKADERTAKIFSAKLGQKAVDANSFLNQICLEITTAAPTGIKFAHMKNDKFATDNQQPKIECGVFEWSDEVWPLC